VSFFSTHQSARPADAGGTSAACDWGTTTTPALIQQEFY
jgi:hypothetical protein